MDNSAQHHQLSSWGYPLPHGDFKRPSEKLDSIQMRPRLKLPNASNRRKWKDMDDCIFTAIVSSIADSELRKGDIDEVLGRFTDTVYDSAADFCGTLTSTKSKESKIGPSPKQRQPALLHKLKVAKREARRELQRTKSRGGDVFSAHKAFMRAVRAHHDLLKAISQSKTLARRRSNAGAFFVILIVLLSAYSVLLSPVSPALQKRLQMIISERLTATAIGLIPTNRLLTCHVLPVPSTLLISSLPLLRSSRRFAERRVTLLLQVLMVFLIYSTNAVIKFDASSGHFCSEFG